MTPLNVVSLAFQLGIKFVITIRQLTKVLFEVVELKANKANK